jgi:hypothetical protein
MEAAKLVKVSDSIDRGINGLPSGGDSAGKIAKGTVGAGPTPAPAINSGKKLDSSLLGPSNRVSNGQGSLYKGSPDNDEDDKALTTSGNGSTGTHASNE